MRINPPQHGLPWTVCGASAQMVFNTPIIQYPIAPCSFACNLEFERRTIL